MTAFRIRAGNGCWKNWRAATLTALMGLVLVSAVMLPASADVSVNATKFHGIVIDGFADDWSTIPGTTMTLIRPLATTERIVDGLTLKVAYDDANIYVLVLVQDDYDYNATNHDLSPALAVLWQIDSAATPDMGGGLGNVDLWHWELDCGAGVLSGYNLLSGNDPDCNLDDEWSSSPTNRFDDTRANEVYGSWSHTNIAGGAGALGTWIFEMRRSLTTSDTLRHDRQFVVGQVAGMSIAYWDADETIAGWTPSGHYASCRDAATLNFNWVQVTLVPLVLPPGPEGPAGPTGPAGGTGPAGLQGDRGLPGSSDAVLVGAAYGGLGLGILGLALGAMAMLGLRRARSKEQPKGKEE